MDTLMVLAGLGLVFCVLVPAASAVDCLYAQAQCNRNENCAVMLMMMHQLCGNSSITTTCQAPDRLQCEGLLQILSQSGQFSKCDCNPISSNYTECKELERHVHRKQCTATVEVALQETPTEATEDSTCIKALGACNGDVTCRQGLVDYLTECRGDPGGGTCRRARCRQSIRTFLDRVPAVYTHALLYCFCLPSDTTCELLWQGLNSKCAYKFTPTPSCLDIRQQCSESTLCSTNFENYQQQCAVSESTGTGCANTYRACRDARLGILGTIVAASCTCRGIEGALLEECERQRLVVIDNPCFTRARQAYYPLLKTEGLFQDLQQNVEKRDKTGCDVTFPGRRGNLFITTGQHIRVDSEDFSDCSQICRCQAEGFLAQCFNILCNMTHTCVKDDTAGHSTTGDCVCLGRQRVCMERQIIPDNFDEPAILLAYSVGEYRVIRQQLHVQLTNQDIVDKLQHTLSMLNHRWPCNLDVVTGSAADGLGKNGTLLLSANHELQEKWKCLNQLSSLVMLINNRAQRISTDVVLSMIKIATVVEGATVQHPSSETSHSHSGAAGVSSRDVLVGLNSLVLMVTIPKFY